MGPGERAVLAAKSGTRYRLDPAHVLPGCIAWMPWAGVIKVTHRDFHKAKDGDGVVVLSGGAKSMHKDAVAANAGNKAEQRPGQRAWNHPAIVLRKEGEMVWVVAVTSYKGRKLNEKFARYSEKARRRLLSEVLPILPADDHPFTKEGDAGGKEYRGLRLDGQGKMFKVGYVKLGDVYVMDWRDLQRFGRASERRYCLDQDSVARLLRVFGKVNPGCARSAFGEKVEATDGGACQPLSVKGTSTTLTEARKTKKAAKTDRNATKALKATSVANKAAKAAKKSVKAMKVAKKAKKIAKHTRLGKS